MTRPLVAVLLASLLLTTTGFAQGPAADWRTVTTPHFRVHYPIEYEAWAHRAASRLEPIRDAVVREVGFAPETITDVLVINPYADANGITIPLLDTPRIVLYTEPPAPDEQIGEYSDWIDLLAVHEVAHLVHLLRPSRNPTQRIVERILPLSPITFRGPRWILEGYATVIEGRLTGAGRPSSSIRAAILRKWAQSGRLPSYAQLNTNRQFLGMSMAYLMGSAYLEWLEERSGPGSLQKLWARMTARQRRSFDSAFQGVFGESPQRLYGRFTAELTANAMDVQRATTLREGELWQETSRNSGDPNVSPNGRQLVMIVRARNKPSKIVILGTNDQTVEEEKFSRRLTRILQRDPEDVAPVRTKPLPRKPLHTFTPPEGGDVENPRWMPDGRSILYSHRQPDREGFLHHDLFRWTPTAENVRITHLGDVYNADPAPDGRSAIAVRSRHGFSQLVRVDLSTGSVAAITEPSLDRIYTHPRVSGDGRRVVFAAHGDAAWRLFVRDLETGAETTLPFEPRGSVATPEWGPNGEIYATVLTGGFVEIHRFTDSTSGAITRTSGGAFQPAPSPDGRLFFMALEPDGFVVRALDTKEQTPLPAVARFERALVPALPPAAGALVEFPAQPLPEPQRYGIGRQELDWFSGQNIAPSSRATELGVRLGDVVGRLDTIALVSLGASRSVRGAALASAWRGGPIEVEAHAFQAKERPSEQSGAGEFLPFGLDLDRRGVELRGTWDGQWPRHALGASGGALLSNVRGADGGDWRPRRIFFLNTVARVRQLFGDVRMDEELRIGGDVGSTDSHAWTQLRGLARIHARLRSSSFSAQYERRTISDANAPLEMLNVGGVPSSVLPRAAMSTRIFDPALPVGTLSGDRYEGWRFEATTPVLPATLFYQQHRDNRQRLSLVGVELEMTQPPMPLVKTPGLELTLGVAYILDDPFDERTKWWLGMRWRP